MYLAVGMAISSLFVGCSLVVDREAGWHNFQTAVARAPQDGYTVYWLGNEFQAGGHTFTGPSVPDPSIAEVQGGGVVIDYDTHFAGGGAGLTLTLYSERAWAASPFSTETRLPRGAVVRQVTVAGLSGVLRLVPEQYTRTYTITLRLDARDGTVVLASTSPGIGRTPGTDLNPLTNEQTFLSVMQNLRPYPQ